MIVLHGDCLQVLPTLSGLDACITDPPYELAFMGRDWDRSGVAFSPDTWRLVYDALKPGAHLLAFGGSRTFARMFCAIEDAGFEYRDTLMFLYGTGFPKSHDISKAIDKAAGAEREVIGPGNRHNSKRCAVAHGDTERLAGGIPDITAPATPEAKQWAGWGTALKPAYEPIGLFRKPLDNCTVAANVLKHGTGAINIDACRVPISQDDPNHRPGENEEPKVDRTSQFGFGHANRRRGNLGEGRWPANVLHDGSDEVEAAFAAFGESKSRAASGVVRHGRSGGIMGAQGALRDGRPEGHTDSGAASRFFYSAKASKADRAGSKHPTVKPLALMRWLVRLITPPGGTVLDCFAGSGTTGEAAMLEGFDAVLIEQEPEYVADIQRRLSNAHGPLFAA